jgi:hypothetical protein
MSPAPSAPLRPNPVPVFDGVQITSNAPNSHPHPPVSPYSFVGASKLPAEGGLSYDGDYSVNDSTVHGVTMVDDPTGLSRKVLKLRTDEAKCTFGYADGSDNVRISVAGAAVLREGDDLYIRNEVYLPVGFPLCQGAAAGPNAAFCLLHDCYDRSGVWLGAGPFALSLFAQSGSNTIFWIEHHADGSSPGNELWHKTNFANGVWHIFLKRIKLSSDPAVGFMELWYAQRGSPLVKQTITGGTYVGQQRHYQQTCSAGSTAITADVTNYHAGRMWTGFTDIYHAGHKVWQVHKVPDVRQLDPYYTGELV